MYVTHVYILYGFLLTGTPVKARVGGKGPLWVLTLEEGRCEGHSGERQEECEGCCGQRAEERTPHNIEKVRSECLPRLVIGI
jgi:hypothetical protein